MRTIFSITQEGPEAKRQAGGYSDGPMEQAALVVPGEMIASSKYWMRGHGTFIEEQTPSQTDDEMASDSTHPAEGLIRSSLAGTVERINKLITVSPLSGRYRPEVGDLVIGRITEVQSKRWKVEAGARQHAVLMLGSVNLPGGVQRRKLESDELQMRFFFQEGDLLVAEVQGFFGDGSMSLHTRSRKYGKLRNGMLLKVPPQLILRLKSHFHILPIGIDLIIGVNGWIWIAQQRAEAVPDESLNEAFEADSDNMYSDVNEPISSKTRENIARLAGAINLLSTHSMPISDVSILRTYEASLEVSRLSRLSAAADDAGHQQMELDDSHDHQPTAPQHLDDFLKAEFRDRVLALLVASD